MIALVYMRRRKRTSESGWEDSNFSFFSASPATEHTVCVKNENEFFSFAVRKKLSNWENVLFRRFSN